MFNYNLTMLIILVLALVWGFAWAWVLQHTEFGKYLVVKRTWLTVVIGIGVDLLLGLWLIDFEAWLKLWLVFALSSVGIILRSLRNEAEQETKQIARILETINDSTTKDS